MQMRFIFLWLAPFLFLWAATSHAADDGWQVYINPRFGFHVEVPPRFIAAPEPANGDGRMWKSRDGRTRIAAFGYNSNPDFGTDFQTSKRKAYGDKSKKYFANGHNWFVVSGTRGQLIYYVKVVLSDRCSTPVVTELHIEYPIDQKSYYDPIFSRISKSFHNTICGEDTL